MLYPRCQGHPQLPRNERNENGQWLMNSDGGSIFGGISGVDTSASDVEAVLVLHINNCPQRHRRDDRGGRCARHGRNDSRVNDSMLVLALLEAVGKS